MGAEERSNPKRNAVGAYEVEVQILYTNNATQIVNAKKWKHEGEYLALSIEDNHLMIVSLRNVNRYSIRPQEEVPRMVT